GPAAFERPAARIVGPCRRQPHDGAGLTGGGVAVARMRGRVRHDLDPGHRDRPRPDRSVRMRRAPGDEENDPQLERPSLAPHVSPSICRARTPRPPRGLDIPDALRIAYALQPLVTIAGPIRFRRGPEPCRFSDDLGRGAGRYSPQRLGISPRNGSV